MGTAIKLGVIGAGSAQFSLGLVRDLCLQESLYGSTVTFMDMDAGRLEMITRLAERYVQELGIDLRFEQTQDRERALREADFVLNTALVGGHEPEEAGRRLAAEHGYYRGVRLQTNLKQYAMMLSVARDMERLCPRAWLIQSSNPVFEGCTLMTRETSTRVIGLCHGFYGYRTLAEAIGVDPDEVEWEIPGVNHWVYLTHFRRQGQDLYPLIDRWIEEQADRYWAEFRGRYGATQPRPPHWTREGLESEFLWVDDTAAGSAKAWEEFPGFYGYYTVRGPKPGATVYAYFADAELPENDPQTVFLAGQFYGAGRVFYLSSPEIWRVRARSDGYFERFYTKLIRHVSQGRLLRGSTRGNLLVERDRYNVGNSVLVKAQLTDVRLEPLVAPSVDLEVQTPDGKLQTLLLKPDESRRGMFSGQFTALEEGAYELSLLVPESQDERLSRRIQVRVPDLERERPERNDPVLQALAQASGGQYYVGIDAMAGRKGLPPVWNQLKDMTRQTFVSGAPDPAWQRDWLRWLMLAICGVLCLEWLLRRLWRLA